MHVFQGPEAPPDSRPARLVIVFYQVAVRLARARQTLPLKREFAEPDENLLVVFFSNGSFDGVILEFVELAERNFVPS